jgi:hypothetical protein
MKNIVTVLLILVALSANSQNWKLLDENKTYFYKHSDSLLITNTIKIDSTVNSVLDSVFHIHTTIKICDTCTVIPSEAVGGVLYHAYAPEIFGTTPTYNVSSNDYEFSDGTIKPHAALSDSWIFNASLSINATVVDKYETTLFGSLDSVKVIELSTLDTIIISKNRGVIRYPDFENPGKYFLLCGFHEGQNSFGEYLPNMWRIYDFNVGDVFSYYLDRTEECGSYAHNLTYTVLEDLSDSYKVSYRVKILDSIFNNWNECFPPLPASFFTTHNYIDTFELTDHAGLLENQYSDAFSFTMSGGDDYSGTFYNLPFHSNDYFTNYYALIPANHFHLVDHKWDSYFGTSNYMKHLPTAIKISDSLFYKIYPSEPLSISGYIYAILPYYVEYLGRVQGWYEHNSDFHFDQMQGYIKNGITVGTIYDFPADLSIESNGNDHLTIYPNPASNQIQLSGNYQEIQFYSLTGQLILKLQNPTQTLFIGNLVKGIYLVKAVDMDGNLLTTKLVLE